jgi:hypothetical protein
LTPATASELTRIVAAWVAAEPFCRALALVGSWARREATSASDLDLLVLAMSLERWSGSLEWLAATGLAAGYQVRAAERARYGRAFSWHIELEREGLLELTFADPSWAEREPIDPGTRRVVADGMGIVADKDGLLTALQQQVEQESAAGTRNPGSFPGE